MDKRCLISANASAIWSTIIALILLLILNAITKLHSFPVLLCFAIIYGIGTHLGYCIGFNFTIIPRSLAILIVIVINFIFLILPIVSKQDNYYGLNMAIFFNFAYIRHLSDGRALYVKLEKEKEENEKNNTPKN